MVQTAINSENKTGDYLQSTVNSKAASRSVSKASIFDNSKTSSETKTSSKDNFKEVLNLKSNAQTADSKRTSNDSVRDLASTAKKDDSKLQEIKDKLEELEEKAESGSKDDVDDILSQLLALLNTMINDNQNVQVTDESQLNGNQSIIDMIAQGDENSSSILDQLAQLLQQDSAENSLDGDTLSSINKILDQLSSKFDSDSTMKNQINDLSSRVSEILDSKESNKVLTLEDMLSKGYSESNSDSSEMSKDKSSFSKEDKFLNSLLDDKNDNTTNQINVFSNRIQGTVQNTETRGLTINKAAFTADIIKDVKYMATNSIKELTVKINPGNLGQITISLTQEDGVMKANLKANSKETTALLSQNLAEIKKELGNQDLKISEVNIELYQEDTTFFTKDSFGRQLSQEQQQSENKGSNTDANGNNSIEEEVIANEAQINSNLDYLA